MFLLKQGEGKINKGVCKPANSNISDLVLRLDSVDMAHPMHCHTKAQSPPEPMTPLHAFSSSNTIVFSILNGQERRSSNAITQVTTHV